MLPDILESVGDLVDSLAPLIALTIVALGTYLTVRAWRGKGASQKALEAIDDKLDLLLEHSDAVRAELGEIQDRVEFTERLLANKDESSAARRRLHLDG